MSTSNTRPLRSQVRIRALGGCEYCHLPEEADVIAFEVDHVIAEQHGGLTELGNLAYTCFECNRRKGPNLTSIDPQTNEITILFNPRTQQWDDHFQLNADGALTGRTAAGRTTIRLLKLNDPERVQERLGLIAAGKLIPNSNLPIRHRVNNACSSRSGGFDAHSVWLHSKHKLQKPESRIVISTTRTPALRQAQDRLRRESLLLDAGSRVARPE